MGIYIATAKRRRRKDIKRREKKRETKDVDGMILKPEVDTEVYTKAENRQM